MIDLHCHMLPGLDDGASDMGVALAMARLAIADGIVTTVCTPHIMPGVYDNAGPGIRVAVERFSLALEEAGIPLTVAVGADVHLDPGLLSGLQSGRVPTLGRSRYFLLEPPHHSAPPRLDEFAFGLVAAGYVPILTHPERLSWIEGQFDLVRQMAKSGVLMQLTAGSLLGRFGRRAKYWAERMLDEDLVDILATDAHDCDLRPPQLSKGRDAIAHRCNDATANRLVATNPLSVLENVLLSKLRHPHGRTEERPAM